MGISRKLYTGFGSILGILILLFLVSFVASQHEHSARNSASSALSNLDKIGRVRFQMMVNRLDLRNFLLSGDPREEANTLKGVSDIQTMLRSDQETATDERLRSAFSGLESTEQTWLEDFCKPLIAKRHEVDSGHATVAELQIAYLQHAPGGFIGKDNKEIDDLESQIQSSQNELNKAADSGAWISGIILIIGTMLAACFGALIAFRTSRSITQPLNQLINVTREIAESGDLDQQIEIRGKDEIGTLASHYRNMISHLKEMANVSAAIAEGKLSVVVEPRSPRDTLANAFQQMLEGLRQLVTQTRDSASQVAGGASQMAAASSESAKVSVEAASAIDEVTSTMHEMSINVQNVVKSTQMQSSSVAETSASIEQMVASIQRVADTSRTLLEICQRSRDEVQTGIKTMDKTTAGLTRTSSAIQSSAQIIDALGKRANEIGKIIEVIDDLAEQTNLLALNAAIEAARAGEHGLGFAVVAEEVRKLAEKSTQSTKEISDLIEGIQKESREAVENMVKSTSMVQEGLELGGELNVALIKISDVVTEVYKFAQQIGGATNEQSNGSTQIAKATSRLTEITQEINSSIEEQASGAQSVVRAMEKMRELVQQSTSSSTELAAAADQMSKLSRGLMDAMDQFVLEEVTRVSRSGAGNGSRRGSSSRENSVRRLEPELARV
jgi:methyl-accepting chemotaxis protein|nr:methyl-accepting chemotaxis protein [Candidatus Acidoferrales bacterium]